MRCSFGQIKQNRRSVNHFIERAGPLFQVTHNTWLTFSHEVEKRHQCGRKQRSLPACSAYSQQIHLIEIESKDIKGTNSYGKKLVLTQRPSSIRTSITWVPWSFTRSQCNYKWNRFPETNHAKCPVFINCWWHNVSPKGPSFRPRNYVLGCSWSFSIACFNEALSGMSKIPTYLNDDIFNKHAVKQWQANMSLNNNPELRTNHLIYMNHGTAGHYREMQMLSQNLLHKRDLTISRIKPCSCSLCPSNGSTLSAATPPGVRRDHCHHRGRWRPFSKHLQALLVLNVLKPPLLGQTVEASAVGKNQKMLNFEASKSETRLTQWMCKKRRHQDLHLITSAAQHLALSWNASLNSAQLPNLRLGVC